MYEQLLQKIKEYSNISIFRHLKPDGDAIYSQMALKDFILDNFDNKNVKCLGNDIYKPLNNLEEVSDDFVSNSLAIVVDCSVESRVDDLRFKSAKEVITVDHHPSMAFKADISFLDTHVSSTAELITKILYSDEFKPYKLSQNVCKYLYLGILSDSDRFTTSNTYSDTLYYASLLAKDGNLLISNLNDEMYNIEISEFNKISKLRSYFVIKDGLGYCKLDQKDLDDIELSSNEAKEYVYEFRNIKEVKIWAIFAYNKTTGLYDASIRSKREFIINKICQKFNGGGHANACGAKGLTPQMVDEMITEFVKLITC